MILFDRCSWTWGDGLENREQDRFSTLVSDFVGKEHVNISEKGKCNDGILRTTMEYCENHAVDLAIIQLTKISRREILDSKGEHYIRLNAGNKDLASLYYYENLNTNADDIANFYKNRFLLEHFFKVKGIPYYIVCLNRKKDLLYNTRRSSWQKMTETKPLTSLYTLFGGGRRDNTPFFNFPNGHPNKKGHQVIAEHIHENIL